MLETNQPTMNPNVPVSDIMTRSVITVNPDDKLPKIRELFVKNNFHHLPVVENGTLIGIISREDFLRVYYDLSRQTAGKTWSDKSFVHLNASGIMTKDPMILDPEDSIGLAADVFLANKFHSLPIVEDGVLTGIVTVHDLLAFSFNSPVETGKETEFEE